MGSREPKDKLRERIHATKTITHERMPISRLNETQLRAIVSRKGYGVADAIGKRSIGAQVGCAGKVHNVEPIVGQKLESPKKLQIGCAGKVIVRIKFYRYRLADYSRAISEKALIDACYYAGITRGDSEREIQLIDENQHKTENREEERTEITFEYPEVDFDNLFEESTRTDGR